MVLPVVGYLVSLGVGSALRYATRQAALSAAKRYGGTVLTKTASQGKKAVDAGSKAGLKLIKQNRKPGATTATRTTPKKPTPTKKAPAKKSPTLKADPKDAPASVAKRKATDAAKKKKANAAKNEGTPLTGTKVQRGLIVAATTAPMFMDTAPKKKSADMSNRAKSQGGRTRAEAIANAQKALAAKSKAQGGGTVLSEMTKKKASPESVKSKSWKDYKTVGAAQKAGADYFTGRDGKKKIAVTQEQLKKSGKSLRQYANKLRKKGKK